MESIAAFCKGKTTLARYSAKPVSPGRAAVSALLGLLVGAVNGLLGAGGGMLAVPLLTGAEGLPAKKAHATAIALILPLSAVSTLVYALTGGGSAGQWTSGDTCGNGTGGGHHGYGWGGRHE